MKTLFLFISIFVLCSCQNGVGQVPETRYVSKANEPTKSVQEELINDIKDISKADFVRLDTSASSFAQRVLTLSVGYNSSPKDFLKVFVGGACTDYLKNELKDNAFDSLIVSVFDEELSDTIWLKYSKENFKKMDELSKVVSEFYGQIFEEGVEELGNYFSSDIEVEILVNKLDKIFSNKRLKEYTIVGYYFPPYDHSIALVWCNIKVVNGDDTLLMFPFNLNNSKLLDLGINDYNSLR